MAMSPTLISDIAEIEQLLARYAAGMTQDDIPSVVATFAADGYYKAFGEAYPPTDFPTLVAAAPKGVYMTGTPRLDLTGDTGEGVQPLVFIDQSNHAMRIGYYTDTFTRTSDGWRLQTRAMTFLRKSGARDSGKPHDPTRPAPSGTASPE